MVPPRPSAAGDGYDPLASGGVQPRPQQPRPARPRSSSAGCEVADRRTGSTRSRSRPTRSPPRGSGLDPHISPAYAALQVARVARARGLDAGRWSASWSSEHTRAATLGFLGEPRVNVLELNLALAGCLTDERRDVQAEEHVDPMSARGRLRVYLGAAPGVGKTFAMLDEGQRRPSAGPTSSSASSRPTDGPQTARDGRRPGGRAAADRASYRGGTFDEMDLDAVLARRPGGRPGRRAGAHQRPRRAQRQALAGRRGAPRRRDRRRSPPSTSSTWSRSTTSSSRSPAIRQQETVPDEVVRRADQIELVDMSPEALRRRLAHGNVYAAEKIDAALTNYFRVGNLTALRELALLWVGRPGRRRARALPRRARHHRHLARPGARRRRPDRRPRGRDADPARRPHRRTGRAVASCSRSTSARGDGLAGGTAGRPGPPARPGRVPGRHLPHRDRRGRRRRPSWTSPAASTPARS